jgi:hypothetical protein
MGCWLWPTRRGIERRWVLFVLFCLAFFFSFFLSCSDFWDLILWRSLFVVMICGKEEEGDNRGRRRPCCCDSQEIVANRWLVDGLEYVGATTRLIVRSVPVSVRVWLEVGPWIMMAHVYGRWIYILSRLEFWTGECRGSEGSVWMSWLFFSPSHQGATNLPFLFVLYFS